MAFVEPRLDIFVCYSRADAAWLRRVQVHLKPLVRQGRIELWDDTRIRAGERWRDEISEALARAKVAVLLISADFFDSDFIAKNELPPLLEAERQRGLVILGVHINFSRFDRDGVLSEYQTINTPDQPIEHLSKAQQEKIFDGLARRIEELLDPPVSVPLTSPLTGTRGGVAAQRRISMRQQPREDSGLGIVELTLERPSQWSGNCFPLLAEVRFGSSDILDEGEGFSIDFGIKKAFLRLDLSGCRIVQGSRNYESTHSLEVIKNIEENESREQRRLGELSGLAEVEFLVSTWRRYWNEGESVSHCD